MGNRRRKGLACTNHGVHVGFLERAPKERKAQGGAVLLVMTTANLKRLLLVLLGSKGHLERLDAAVLQELLGGLDGLDEVTDGGVAHFIGSFEHPAFGGVRGVDFVVD